MSRAARVVLALTALAVSGPALADPCTEAAVRIELKRGIPPGLLHAIALSESGLSGIPRAYALRIGSRSAYPTELKQAQQMLQAAAADPGSVNVGCMQLSLRFHGAAFQPPEAILEPGRNVGRAADYLLGLRREHKAWDAALRRFQGGSALQQATYVCRVWSYLRQLAPASAALLDARRCAGPRPHIDPATIRAAHELRLKLGPLPELSGRGAGP